MHGGDAATARADLGEVDDRELERDAGAGAGAPEAALAAHLEVVRHARPAATDDARLGGRAAHVERDDVVGADRPTHDAGRDDARRTAGFDGGHRQRRGARRAHHVTGGVHDLDRAPDPDPAQALAEAGEVLGHHRRDDARRSPWSWRARTPASPATRRSSTRRGPPGSAPRRARATRCSWSGWAYECKRQTATPTGALATTCVTTSSMAASVSSMTGVPVASTRSRTSKVRRASTGGGAGV